MKIKILNEDLDLSEDYVFVVIQSRRSGISKSLEIFNIADIKKLYNDCKENKLNLMFYKNYLNIGFIASEDFTTYIEVETEVLYSEIFDREISKLLEEK